MKNWFVVAALALLTACASTDAVDTTVVETQPAVVEQATTPSVAKFAVGDEIVLTMPDGAAFNATVMAVGEVLSYEMSEGVTQRSQSYSVQIERVITTGDGSSLTMLMLVSCCPEFAMTARN